jgi:hypothetical protein
MNVQLEELLKATVKATPVDADGKGSTIQHDALVLRIRNNARWTPEDMLNYCFAELQNRWSAS